MPAFNLKAGVLMEHLRPIADGKQIVSLLKEFNNVTLEAIASVNIFLFLKHLS